MPLDTCTQDAITIYTTIIQYLELDFNVMLLIISIVLCDRKAMQISDLLSRIQWLLITECTNEDFILH